MKHNIIKQKKLFAVVTTRVYMSLELGTITISKIWHTFDSQLSYFACQVLNMVMIWKVCKQLCTQMSYINCLKKICA